LQSNAHDTEGRSDAAASRGNSVIRDLEGAMAADVMGDVALRDGLVVMEHSGCGEVVVRLGFRRMSVARQRCVDPSNFDQERVMVLSGMRL
jgi:hypothetical protein